MKNTRILIAIAALCSLFVVALALRPAEVNISAPPVRLQTEAERRVSLEGLRAAWLDRSRIHSPAHERAERAFLNRLAYFIRNTRGKEIYPEACRLWNECYRDHASRYSDFIEDS